ncbi:hypothetical protein H0266_14890 [Halobacillus locisalis]|uniref:Uncharacterized protein n=1 Tax=Halobacillus locisalis TaxID=220753 RepID=A0A838CW92_9BACI|nr:hypothetical protein [Halobacillus locisalis]MBA2176181.1 hypothetical protein [Halobacillus locisalis]
MKEQERKRLRRKQLLYINAIMISIVGLSLIILNFLSDKTFFLLFAALLLITGIVERWKYKTGRYAWTSDMRKLALYEEKVMKERSFEKERQSQYWSRFLIAPMIFLQGFAADSNRTLIDHSGFLWILTAIVVILIPMLNVGLIMRAKKIDEGRGYYEEIKQTSWMTALLFLVLVVLYALIMAFVFNL